MHFFDTLWVTHGRNRHVKIKHVDISLRRPCFFVVWKKKRHLSIMFTDFTRVHTHLPLSCTISTIVEATVPAWIQSLQWVPNSCVKMVCTSLASNYCHLKLQLQLSQTSRVITLSMLQYMQIKWWFCVLTSQVSHFVKNMKGAKKSLGTSCFIFSDGIAVVFNELVVGSQSYLIDPNSCLLVDIENEEGGSWQVRG